MTTSEAVSRLRKRQATTVMPLIGPLLDAWDDLPNDVKSDIALDSAALVDCVERIRSAMEDSDHDPE